MRNHRAGVRAQLPKNLEKVLFRELQLQGTKNLKNVIWLNDFRAAIRNGYVPNYDKEVAPFNYLFFGANFIKARTAFLKLIKLSAQHHSKYRILDLGCGAGASSAGVLAGLMSKDSRIQIRVEFIGVDCNPIQLSSYRKIFGAWANTMPNISVKTMHADALDFLKANPHGWDLILCSYLNVECPSKYQNKLVKTLNYVANIHNADVLMIDYKRCSPDGAAILLSTGKKYRFSKVIMEFPFLHILCPDVCPKYCFHRRAFPSLNPPNPLAAYFRCWQKQDANGIRRIFHPNATYEINAQRQLRGTKEIMNYWKQNASEQRQVECIIHNYVGNSEEQTVHWTARFYRADQQEIYAVHGILWVEITDKRISRLFEFYTKNTFQAI